MLRCPTPPTSIPSAYPKKTSRVLTSAENLKNIEEKQKKKEEAAKLKLERQKAREDKKKEKKKLQGSTHGTSK